MKQPKARKKEKLLQYYPLVKQLKQTNTSYRDILIIYLNIINLKYRIALFVNYALKSKRKKANEKKFI